MLIVSVTFKVNCEEGPLGLHLFFLLVLIGHLADGDVRSGELVACLGVVLLQGRVQGGYLATALVVCIRLVLCQVHFTCYRVVLVRATYLVILVQGFFIFVVG